MARFLGSCVLVWLVSIASNGASAAVEWSEPLQLAAGAGPSAVATADLTGDGHLDLAVVHRVSDDAWIFVGDGTGGFTFLQSFAVGPFPQGIAAADLNGDGAVDLATTAVPFNTGTATVWIGDGGGNFSTSEVLTADDGPRAIELVDLDNDGRLDLVVTNATRGNVSVFLGDGDGTFGPERRIPVGSAGSFPTDLAVADFDADGTLDIVTSNAQSSDASVGRLLGNGDGSFGTAVAFPTSCSRPESVTPGDFDRDGHPDIAVACFASAEVSVMLGDGLGGFALPQQYSFVPEQANPYWILAVDLDRDGLADLATSNNGGFSVLKGRADGSFAAPRHFVALPGSFFGAVAGDFDEDGWPDLAFANFGTNQLWVYRNASGGCGDEPCPGVITVDGSAAFSWLETPDAQGYDVVRGELSTLLASGGDFAAATEVCLSSSAPAATFSDSAVPNPGEAFWYLVRAAWTADRQSYDALSGNLFGGRDAGIFASGFDCFNPTPPPIDP